MTMTKWKCKRSGNVIELPDSETTGMLKHPGYEQVVEEVKEVVKQPVQRKKTKES